jgi:thiol-disulfide isomerase/thioredoxin
MTRPDFCLGLAAVSLLLAAASICSAADHKPLEIGQPAPGFALPGVDGRTYKLADFKDAKLLVIVFTCNHCPTAQAYEDRIIELDRDYKDRGVKLVAISPNDPLALRLDELAWTDLTDSLEDMKIRAKDRDFRFPYLYDGETQRTSEAFGVQATPHVFIFDRERKLRYQGRIDNSDVHEVTTHEMRDAIEALLAGKPVPVETTRVFGCSTKWSDKRSTVVSADKHWDAEPVDLEAIDADAVRKLAANDTEKLLLVNLWATWCGPCVEELPELGVINHMYKSRPFRFVTISVDEASAKDEALAALKKARASNTNYLFTSTDKDKLAEALDPKWPGPLPYTVLIAPGGKVLYRHAGALEAVDLKKAVVDYLGRTYAAKDAKPQKSQ